MANKADMTKRELSTLLGAQIKKQREECRVTQKQLAERIGLKSNNYISNMEMGKKLPSVYTLYKIEQQIGAVWQSVLQGTGL
jgi:transcriptional regulator with XRE-family HTH domain